MEIASPEIRFFIVYNRVKAKIFINIKIIIITTKWVLWDTRFQYRVTIHITNSFSRYGNRESRNKIFIVYNRVKTRIFINIKIIIITSKCVFFIVYNRVKARIFINIKKIIITSKWVLWDMRFPYRVIIHITNSFSQYRNRESRNKIFHSL